MEWPAIFECADAPSASERRGSASIRPARRATGFCLQHGGAFPSPSPAANRRVWRRFASGVRHRQGVIDAVRSGFSQLGYTPVATAGILGNIRQESNFDPRVFTSGGDSGTAHGLFQDRGPRFTGLIDYAKQRGIDPNSP